MMYTADDVERARAEGWKAGREHHLREHEEKLREAHELAGRIKERRRQDLTSPTHVDLLEGDSVRLGMSVLPEDGRGADEAGLAVDDADGFFHPPRDSDHAENTIDLALEHTRDLTPSQPLDSDQLSEKTSESALNITAPADVPPPFLSESLAKVFKNAMLVPIITIPSPMVRRQRQIVFEAETTGGKPSPALRASRVIADSAVDMMDVQSKSSKKDPHPRRRKRRHQPQTPTFEPRNEYFAINDIRRESKRNYLIDWAGFDRNGKRYKQTWVPKENVTETAVVQWESRKALRKRRSM